MALSLPPLDGAKDVPALVRLLRSWADGLARALRLPAVSEQGVVVTVRLTAGSTSVNHGLGKAPSGWLLLRAQGTTGAAVAEVASDSKTLVLTSTNTITATLWIWP